MEITKEEREKIKRATEVYMETKRRKSELPEKHKKLFKQLEAVDLGYYDVTMEIVWMVAYVYQNNAINAFKQYLD